MTVTPEQRKRSLENSMPEIARNPITLLEKLENFSKLPKDKKEEKELVDWLLQGWKEINRYLLSLNKFEIGGHGIKRSSYDYDMDTAFFSTIKELSPRIPRLEETDTLCVILDYQPTQRNEKKDRIKIIFLADGENRDRLKSLSVEVLDLESNGKSTRIKKKIDVKVDPKFKIIA